ncbi:hypothetical protein EON79_16740 [bacterium]|nr:MAG: hypothetical protein EON79_16740 [bacterium]
MRRLLPFVLLLAGCGASSSEEAQAAKVLAPKPVSAESKAQIDRIKAQFPQGASTHAGASPTDR